MDDTVVLTMSEFGRAVNENGNRGTDHGHGNAMMVIGGGVRGGHVYGRWPGLARDQRYDGRDLAVTTDFRDVFGEIVDASPRRAAIARPIFPGYASNPAKYPGAVRLGIRANRVRENQESGNWLGIGRQPDFITRFPFPDDPKTCCSPTFPLRRS